MKKKIYALLWAAVMSVPLIVSGCKYDNTDTKSIKNESVEKAVLPDLCAFSDYVLKVEEEDIDDDYITLSMYGDLYWLDDEIETDPCGFLTEYIELIMDEYDMELITSEVSGVDNKDGESNEEIHEYWFEYVGDGKVTEFDSADALVGEKGDPKCHLKLVLDINYTGSVYELYINCSPGFEWIEADETTTCQLEKSSNAKDEYEMRKSKAKTTLEPKTTLKPTSKTKTAETSLPSKNTSLTIPSVESFTNGALVTGQTGKNKNAYERFITFDNGTKGEEDWVLKEYIPLLQNNYNFELIDEHEEHYRAGTSADSYEYWLNYTGSGSTVKFRDTYAETMYGKDIECNLRLHLWIDNISGTYRVSIYYSPELSVADTSDRTGYKLTGSSGGSSGRSSSGTSESSSSDSSSGGSISYPSTEKEKCSYCDGNGKRTCKTCDGKGYMEVRTTTPKYSGSSSGGTKTTRKSCPNSLCHDGKVDCFFCDGDGYR